MTLMGSKTTILEVKITFNSYDKSHVGMTKCRIKIIDQEDTENPGGFI